MNRLAYDAGSVIGGLAVGVGMGPGIKGAITGESPSGWSVRGDIANQYKSNYPNGSFGKWMGSGPDDYSGGVAAGMGGVGLGQLIGGVMGNCN